MLNVYNTEYEHLYSFVRLTRPKVRTPLCSQTERRGPCNCIQHVEYVIQCVHGLAPRNVSHHRPSRQRQVADPGCPSRLYRWLRKLVLSHPSLSQAQPAPRRTSKRILPLDRPAASGCLPPQPAQANAGSPSPQHSAPSPVPRNPLPPQPQSFHPVPPRITFTHAN